MTETDKAALARAIEIARKDPGERRRIDEKLANGEDWDDVAGRCACWCQHDALALMPWQLPPIYYAAHLDSVLREPFGDPSGRREAGEVLKKLLALGLSRFEPDPLGALEQAEAKRRAAK
jgi:hypothetical protein